MQNFFILVQERGIQKTKNVLTFYKEFRETEDIEMGGFYSVRTSTPNTWAYQMFPGGTPYSITNPQDSIGNLNDIQLTNFDLTVDSLERNSVAMMNNFEQMYKMYQAQIAQWSQNTYPNISANTNINMPGVTPGVTPGGYASKIEDSQVAGNISKLGSHPIYGPELKKTVTLDNGTKVTYLKRLDDLIKDYLTSETPLLSADDFAKIKEIAGKIAKAGTITKEDFLTLKKIVDANKGQLGTEKAAEDEKKAAEDEKKAAEDEKKAKEEAAKAPVDKPYEYQQTVETKAVVDAAVENYWHAMDGWGTTMSEMNAANDKVNQYNVIEIIEGFKKYDSTRNGETLIEAILDDFSAYGLNSSDGIHGWAKNTWYSDADDCKGYVDNLANSMYERVLDLSELKNANGDLKLSEATLDNLDNKMKALQRWQETMTAAKDHDMTDEQKNNLKTAFNGLVDAIKAAEIEAYGRGHENKVYVPAAQA